MKELLPHSYDQRTEILFEVTKQKLRKASFASALILTAGRRILLSNSNFRGWVISLIRAVNVS